MNTLSLKLVMRVLLPWLIHAYSFFACRLLRVAISVTARAMSAAR
jgi:hypothetical protein